MTVRRPPVRMEAPASTGSTPSSVSAPTAGREVSVMPVSVWLSRKGSFFGLPYVVTVPPTSHHGNDHQSENLMEVKTMEAR